MNIILEERENIIKNNDTAQETLLSILDKFEPQLRELSISKSLHGNLDFSVLKTRGFKNVKSILLLEKGEITSISNLPEELEKLVVSHQYLIELENIPPSIKELDIQHNFISNLDISSLTKLKKLEISDNHFTKLENLPESLEELYCNNNRIKVLNLKNNLSLRVLHTSNNKAIIIENLPPSIVDFKSENNPFIEIDYANLHSSKENNDKEKTDADNENKINYIESLSEYFKLKNNYEEKNFKEKKRIYDKYLSKQERKKNLAKWVPKCIQCKQPGGTLFSKKKYTYFAVCGNKRSPCKLNIEIFNGSSSMLDYMMTIIGLEELVDVKERIIKQKLDNIFNYENEKESLKNFKENLEEFTFYNSEYTELLQKNNQLYKDEIRSELIARKTQHIYDLISSINELIQQYKKDDNKHLLKTAMEIQVKELIPEINNLRILRYEIMEIIYTNTKKVISEGIDKEETKEYKESILFQRYHSLQKMEYLTGKPPKVVKYS